MGVVELWSILRKKKFEPGIAKALHHSIRYRLDLLSCLYIQIRRAICTYSDTEEAHEAIHRALSRFVDPPQPEPSPLTLTEAQRSIVIYVDGEWPLEKHETHQKRLKDAEDALNEATGSISVLEQRVRQGKWPAKQKERNFTKALNKAMILTYDDKKNLAAYLKKKGWSVVLAEYEADVEIAKACDRNDIVISRDSDMLVYENVTTVWRPITPGCFHVYDVMKATNHLALPSRSHLSALGIVSKNDYNRNIQGFGSATNLSLIKSIPWNNSGKYHVA